MPSKCFIVAGMDDRIDLLNRCVRCFKNSPYEKDDLYVYFQGNHFDMVENKGVFKDVVIDERPRGVFTPRYELMKRYAKSYDYTVLIDDDLFITENTDYNGMMRVAEKLPYVGCVNCTTRSNAMSEIIEKRRWNEYYNIEGGMLFPRRSIEVILDYFKDKEKDYSHDVFWLLLWVKGYDWYKDWRSSSIHVGGKMINGEVTGYRKLAAQLDYEMIMPEWFEVPPVVNHYGKCQHDIPTMKQAKEEAFIERMRNLKLLGREEKWGE